MKAVATLLRRDADQTTRVLWNQLEACCGLSGIRLTPTPHFSWLTAADFKEQKLREEFHKLIQKINQFEVVTSGLGIFTSEKPILYLPIVKTKKLTEVHEEIWKVTSKYGDDVNEVYDPNSWIPHITLAHNDLTKDTIQCALGSLIDLNITLTIRVDNLALIFSTPDSSGISFFEPIGE